MKAMNIGSTQTMLNPQNLKLLPNTFTAVHVCSLYIDIVHLNVVICKDIRPYTC